MWHYSTRYVNDGGEIGRYSTCDSCVNEVWKNRCVCLQDSHFFSLLYLWYRKNPYFISGKGFCLVIFLKKYMLFSCDVLHGGCTQKIFWYSSGLNCSDSKYSPLIITSFIVELLLLKLFRKFSLNFTSWHLMLLCPVQQYIGKMFLPFSKVMCINCVSGM